MDFSWNELSKLTDASGTKKYGVLSKLMYEISADKWMNDVTKWPKIDYPDLFNYLVNSKGSFDAKCLKNYKSLAAYEYVISAAVTDQPNPDSANKVSFSDNSTSSSSNVNLPSTSQGLNVTPQQIRPFPKVARTVTSQRKGRKSIKSCILTDTPEKERLELEYSQKTKKVVKGNKVRKVLAKRLLESSSSESEQSLHFDDSTDEESFIEKDIDNSPIQDEDYEKFSKYVYCPDSPLQKFRILGADVQPSQRIRNEVLKTWVIATNEGTVQMAHCTCMAGFGETCSHVAAVLFKIELVVRTGATRQGPTEALCTWNNKFSNNVTSLPMTEIDLRKRKWDAVEKARKVNVLPRKKVPPLSKKDIADIRAVQPNAVFFTSYVSDSSETDSASDDEVNLPLILVDLFKSSASVINSDSIKVHFSVQNCKSLEEATKKQESLWKQHKAGRLTSSNFGVVLKRKKWLDKFADSMLFPKEISNVPAIKWGKIKEKIAVQCYVESTKSNHIDFEYEPAGLHIIEI
ncbi:hypothetical protein JTE90_003368 [Oedothorax gibbosus]|uniref:SWIM-type domain-containing protein n=1 Tax=Oedothorax gibbosus TaxID=931172 RepID=A0AAV6TXJ0_9ARAC|nr:hypothetical protein JTE90_003368 [Oedothorax gibbosus]